VFVLDGPRVHLPRIEINTDGAETTASGEVDFSHWPNMQYDVKSRVHFPRMREIFFTDEKWRLAGDGDFTGTFRLFDGGRNLSGTPPPGIALMTASLDGARAADGDHSRHEWGPFAPMPPAPHLPIGGEFGFTLTPARWQIDNAIFRSERTHVRFDGAADW